MLQMCHSELLQTLKVSFIKIYEEFHTTANVGWV
jgi:hypothetical protein